MDIRFEIAFWFLRKTRVSRFPRWMQNWIWRQWDRQSPHDGGNVGDC